MIILIYILLSMFLVAETSGGLARAIGFFYKNPISGYTLNTSLSIISRFLTFLYLPLLGYLSDTGKLTSNFNPLIYGTLSILIGQIFVLVYRKPISNILYKSVRSIANEGKVLSFKLIFHKESKPLRIKIKNSSYIREIFKKLRILVILAYIPLYLSWPLAISLIGSFSEYRATLLGSTSISNGFNTLFLTLFFDPYVASLSKKYNLSAFLFYELPKEKTLAAFLAFLIAIFLYFIFNFFFK